jgi:RNA-binding protein NOB1
LCKNPIEKFCPSCGNTSLLRTSITYLPQPTPEHPQGYIVHLKKNFRYNNRGTIFSLPTPLSSSGASKKSGQAIILRPDQKEWIKGMHAYDVMKRKEEKRAVKEAQGGPDADWTPSMLLGEKGRKVNANAVRTGKDGLPLIGMGKKVRAQSGSRVSLTSGSESEPGRPEAVLKDACTEMIMCDTRCLSWRARKEC